MENKVALGNIIKNKRLQLNLRMDDVAKEIGVTRSTLWSIENGTGNYSIDSLILSRLRLTPHVNGYFSKEFLISIAT